MTVSRPLPFALLASMLAATPALAVLQEAAPAPAKPTPSQILEQAPPPLVAPTPPAQTPSLEDELMLARDAVAARDPDGALEHYLRALARDPQDLEALTGAGHASLEIGDPNAAINFYARAEQKSPRNGRIKAGIGAAMVQLLQPQAALRLFDEAVKLGIPVADIAADRGLAWDLRGDTNRARADYELALKARPDPETTRRLALSIAIAGDPLEALATLDPLLRKQDKAAWRARAFVLAISGDVVGAEETARAALQPMQAEALKPFFARLAQLKPNQKAAAVHFGQFPSDGRQYSETELLAAAGVSLPEPLPEAVVKPIERKAASDPMADDNGDNIDIGEIVRRATAEFESRPKAAVAATAPAPAAATRPTPEMIAAAPRQAATMTVTPSMQIAATASTLLRGEARPAPVSDADKLRAALVGSKAAAKAVPETKIVPQLDPALEKRLAAEKLKAEKAKAEAAKEAKAKAVAKAKAPARHWVQVATGAYKPDLDKEWARLKGKYGSLLTGRTPLTTPLNRTNRLLIGPFKSADEAQDFVNKAAGGGFATSRFTSADGQIVEKVQ